MTVGQCRAECGSYFLQSKVSMSRSFLFDATRSFLADPQFEEQTTEVRKSAWSAYVRASNAALDRYEIEKEKARADYIRNRRGYLAGSILRPSLKQLMSVWPTEAQLSEFDQREAGQLAEFEKMVFVAARNYALASRDARLTYWKTVEENE
jgi:hypothetical protein